MKTKIVGILVVLVVAAFALTAQAQSYPYSSSYGGIQAHSQMLNSQMAVIGARMSLGYVEGGPSTSANPALARVAADLEAQALRLKAPNATPAIGASLGMTQEQIDQLWALHAKVEQLYAEYVAKMHTAGRKVTLLKYVVPSKDPMLPDTIYVLPVEGLPPSIANAIPGSATSTVSVPATSH